MTPRRGAVFAVLALVLSVTVVDAAPRRWAEVAETLLQTVREHHRALAAALPRREEDLRVAAASLERRSALYARGMITRDELAGAAREVTDARAQLESTRAELSRTSALIAEIEARRRLATLRPLRPGQYEASEGFVRYAGSRTFSTGARLALERYFSGRVGRALPVSADGQTDVHTRLGLDHRHAVDLAVHPDSAEGRLVMSWLRAHDIPFLAFRGAHGGAATGAHVHVGPPSERLLLNGGVSARASASAPPTPVARVER